MRLGYIIRYLPDVAASLSFYEQAFGQPRRFLHESGPYGELATGDNTLALAAHALGDGNFPGGHVHASASAQPLGMEIGLVIDDQALGPGRVLGACARPWVDRVVHAGGRMTL